MNSMHFSAISLISWMLYTLVISVVITLAALAAHDFQRAAIRPARWVWLTSIIALFVFAASAPFRGVEKATVTSMKGLSGPQGNVDGTIESATGFGDWIVKARTLAVSPVVVILSRADQLSKRTPAGAGRAIVLVWSCASLMALTVLLASYRRMQRRLRHLPLQDVGGATVRVSTNVGPAVVGLMRPEIMVPSWLLTRSMHEQRMVVTHESEHVAAGDQWLLLLACVAVAAMPWNPALWFALSRLRLAVEIDCDQRVLQSGETVEQYGEALIDLSAERSLLPLGTPAFPSSYSNLERRLIAMTQKPTRFTFVRRTFGAAIAATVLMSACESKLPTSAEVEGMDVASAERQAVRTRMLDTSKVQYIVDGRVVDAEIAKAIAPEEISSVNVLKRSAAGSEIRVSTRRRAAANDSVGNTQFWKVEGDDASLERSVTSER